MTDELNNGRVNIAFNVSDEASNAETRVPTNFKTEFQLDNQLPPSYANASNDTGTTLRRIKQGICTSMKFVVHILVGAYFGYATYYHIDIENHECQEPGSVNPLCGMKFCTGYGMLLLLIIFTYFGLFYYYVFKPKFGKSIHRRYTKPAHKWWMHFTRLRVISLASIVLLLAAFAIFLYFETRNNPRKLVSLTAPCFFILTGYVFSTNRSAIKWRTVITGITCQFLLGVICIRWDFGRKIFECFGNKIANFLAFTDEGVRFVYGDLILTEGVFAFVILSVIFFFSFVISILYYLGVMQRIVLTLGWLLQQLIDTTVCESVIAAANIFLGMSESPLLIKPYIKLLTASEIHAIMVSGFATVSGSVLAAFLLFGASVSHLITSSVMAAPAALAFAKLYMPETEESKTRSNNIQLEKSEDNSLLEAASSGANSAAPIIMGIISNMIAFLAFMAFVNALVSWFGSLVGHEEIDFEWIFSKIFIPLAWAMGVPNQDCEIIARIVAKKSIINEFVAYETLGQHIKAGDIEARSVSITTFAICGFANPTSLGIMIAAMGTMAPTRRGTIAAVAFRAVMIGSIVCFVSASFAGLLVQEEEERNIYSKIYNTTERRNVTIAFFQEKQ